MNCLLMLLCLLVHNIHGMQRNVFLRPQIYIKENIVTLLPKENDNFSQTHRDVYQFYDEDDYSIKVIIREEYTPPIYMWAS